jgi:hypothetical protein
MSLILLSPALMRADTIAINVDFGGGFTGTGSFNTDGTCDPCIAGTSLTNFTFTVDDDTFNELGAVTGALEYLRTANTLLSSTSTDISPGDNAEDVLRFLPIGIEGLTDITFHDSDETPASVEAIGTIALVPEPSSLVLLAGGIGLLVIGLTRRRSARMRGGIR